jgi:hypothetical protein
MKHIKPQLFLLVVFVIMAIISVFFSSKASADEVNMSPEALMKQCMDDTFMKAIAYGGTYGAGVGALGGIVVAATAPVGVFTLATGAIYVGITTMTGGALGIGSAAMATIGIDSKHENAIAKLCQEEVAKQMVSTQLEEAKSLLQSLPSLVR